MTLESAVGCDVSHSGMGASRGDLQQHTCSTNRAHTSPSWILRRLHVFDMTYETV